MTRIKLCGMKRAADIQAANRLRPDFIGFVFAHKSKRCVTPEQAAGLKEMLDPEITAVGVFVDENPEIVAALLNSGIIDIAQLHGTEDEDYLTKLRKLTDKSLIKAFRIRSRDDLDAAEKSSADFVLLDAGAGDGKTFDWNLLINFSRPCFLAGGLAPENVREAIERCHPYAVDVSSGIETDGCKDEAKMEAFVNNVKMTE